MMVLHTLASCCLTASACYGQVDEQGRRQDIVPISEFGKAMGAGGGDASTQGMIGHASEDAVHPGTQPFEKHMVRAEG